MLDKKWIEVDNRASMVYIEGVDKFLDFAFYQPGVSDKIRCPCNGCRNTAFKYRREVRFHLFKKGFVRSYKTWTLHGEKFNESLNTSNVVHNDNMENLNHNDMIRMVHDTSGFVDMGVQEVEGNAKEEPNEEAKKFYRLLEDANVDLYPNSKLSKLSFIVKLLRMKCLHNLTDIAMNDMLSLFKESLPENALIPDSYYDARKTVEDLGSDYVKIHACNNNCILYEQAQSCPVCGLSRRKDENMQRKIPCKSQMTRDEILLQALGEKLGTCGKDAGKKVPTKRGRFHENIQEEVQKAMDSVKEHITIDLTEKQLQREEQITADLTEKQFQREEQLKIFELKCRENLMHHSKNE